MTTPRRQFGIYFNGKDSKVVRITSPYWIPQAPDWICITEEVNATLVAIRQLIREKKLAANPDSVAWGSIPTVD